MEINEQEIFSKALMLKKRIREIHNWNDICEGKSVSIIESYEKNNAKILTKTNDKIHGDRSKIFNPQLNK
jgi:hypothetical protein